MIYQLRKGNIKNFNPEDSVALKTVKKQMNSPNKILRSVKSEKNFQRIDTQTKNVQGKEIKTEKKEIIRKPQKNKLKNHKSFQIDEKNSQIEEEKQQKKVKIAQVKIMQKQILAKNNNESLISIKIETKNTKQKIKLQQQIISNKYIGLNNQKKQTKLTSSKSQKFINFQKQTQYLNTPKKDLKQNQKTYNLKQMTQQTKPFVRHNHEGHFCKKEDQRQKNAEINLKQNQQISKNTYSKDKKTLKVQIEKNLKIKNNDPLNQSEYSVEKISENKKYQSFKNIQIANSTKRQYQVNESQRINSISSKNLQQKLKKIEFKIEQVKQEDQKVKNQLELANEQIIDKNRILLEMKYDDYPRSSIIPQKFHYWDIQKTAFYGKKQVIQNSKINQTSNIGFVEINKRTLGLKSMSDRQLNFDQDTSHIQAIQRLRRRIQIIRRQNAALRKGLILYQ